jgi:hypothetical protein
VQPTGSKSFYAVYSRQGRPRWLRLGDARDLTVGDARSMAAQTMAAVAKGSDPAAEMRAQRTSGTFADLAQRALSGCLTPDLSARVRCLLRPARYKGKTAQFFPCRGSLELKARQQASAPKPSNCCPSVVRRMLRTFLIAIKV